MLCYENRITGTNIVVQNNGDGIINNVINNQGEEGEAKGEDERRDRPAARPKLKILSSPY